MSDAGRPTWRRLALNLTLGAMTVAGFVMSAKSAGWWAIPAAVAACIWIYLQIAEDRQNKNSTVFDFPDETHPECVRFFKRWYGQDGDHAVFCNDLNWLEPAETAPVLHALCQLGARARIFLGDDGASACQTIRAAGGHIYVVPREIAAINVKLSLNRNLESKSIIARRKTDLVRPNVRFTRTSDVLMVGLAETLIEACTHAATGGSTNVATVPW